MHERRHVHHLDRDPGRHRRLTRCGQEAEKRAEALATRRKSLTCDLLCEPRLRGDRAREPRLDFGHVRRYPGRRVYLREGAHVTVL